MKLLFNRNLYLAGDVLKNEEGHGFAVAEILGEAAHKHFLLGLGGNVADVCSLHNQYSFYLRSVSRPAICPTLYTNAAVSSMIAIAKRGNFRYN